MRTLPSRLLLIFLTLLTAAIMQQSQSMEGSEKANQLDQSPVKSEKKSGVTEPLQVYVTVRTQPVRLSSPCEIEVRVVNKSTHSLLVNKRLSVGYKGSHSRELFAEVFKEGTSEVVSQQALLYERPFSRPDDYAWIEPEQSASTSFNLFEWYLLPSPGSYELVVCYNADEALAPKPADLLVGTYPSNRVPLIILP